MCSMSKLAFVAVLALSLLFVRPAELSLVTAVDVGDRDLGVLVICERVGARELALFLGVVGEEVD